MVTGRPFQYNLPVGIILFYRINELDTILKGVYRQTTFKNKDLTKKAVIKYMDYLHQLKPSQPHLDAIYDTTFKYLKFLKNIDTTITIPNDPVVDILTEIIYKFTCEPCMAHSKNYFDYKRYFFEVFLVNADLHGFLTSYINILDIYIETSKTPTQSPTMVKYLQLFKKYCLDLKYAVTPINTTIFKEEFKKINTVSKSDYKKDLDFFNIFHDTSSRISKKTKKTKKAKQTKKVKQTKKAKQTKKVKQTKKTKKTKQAKTKKPKY